MPQYETVSPSAGSKPARSIVEHLTLPSASSRAPGGVSLNITKSPHRNGKPDHFFFEAWFQWDGGTLRSSTVIHDPTTREFVCDFIHDLTDVDHDALIETTMTKYDWNKTPATH